MSDGQGGWVIAGERPHANAPRFFLVAATGPAQALELAKQNCDPVCD